MTEAVDFDIGSAFWDWEAFGLAAFWKAGMAFWRCAQLRHLETQAFGVTIRITIYSIAWAE
jgi:hypothetical protein